jgi:DNA-binding IscR family transcriptional regulator
VFEVVRRADDAQRVMMSPGGETPGARLPAAKVVGATWRPQPFLHKISADLAGAGLLLTRAGRRGRLALARPAGRTSIGDFLEAIDRPLCLNVSLARRRRCPQDRVCPAHSFLGKLQSTIVQALERVSLADLVAERRRLKGVPAAVEKVVPLPISLTISS